MLHVITGLGVGGAEHMLRRLIASYPDPGERHAVVSLRGIEPTGRALQAMGVEVIGLGLDSLLGVPGAVHRLCRIIQARRPAVVQTWMYHADLVGGIAARLAGRREIVWGIRATRIPQSRWSRTAMVVRACAMLSHWVPKVIVCCAESARSVHAAYGYDKRKLRVVPNGFTLPGQGSSPADRAACRAKLGLDSGGFVVGMVARFDPLKDYRNLVGAAARVLSRIPEARFLLVGKGVDWKNRRLTSWIKSTGYRERFTLLSERDDVPVCLAAMDVFCLSSRHEGFPNVVGEAMAMSVPCVVTAAGDAEQIVGETGFVVPTQDPVALGDALVRMLLLPADERRQLGEMARRRVESTYSMAAVRERFEAAYREACSS